MITIVRYIFGFILIIYWQHSNSQSGLQQVQELGAKQEYNNLEWTGHLNRMIPVRIAVSIDHNAEVSGYIEYADNRYRWELLGELIGKQIKLYAYDDYHQVIGQLTGLIDDRDGNWHWSLADGSNTVSIANESLSSHKLMVYESTDQNHEFYIRPNHKSFVVGEDFTGLKWASFDCIQEDCYEEHPRMNRYNAMEFEWKKDEKNITIGALTYQPKIELRYAQESYFDERSSYGFIYPILDNGVFDTWVMSKVTMAREVFHSYVEQDKDGDGSEFVYGDFFITALSDKVVSGYLYYSGNMSNNIVTIPFIFDQDKSKFYKISDLLRADFDYPFFLDQYLGKIKRGRLINEESQVQSVLKQEHFQHYVLCNSGILFFTDFNTLFGRRSIVVPYTELQGFINNKSINNFIKKKA